MYPEAGGSSSFARRAFNEFWSFFAAWAQMLTYVATIATSAFFVPHYLGGLFWDELKHSARRRDLHLHHDRRPGRDQHRRRQGVHGRQRAAGGRRLPHAAAAGAGRLLPGLQPARCWSTTSHSGVAPTWTNFVLAIPIGMLAYTGIETVSNMSEEAKDEATTIPEAIARVRLAVFAIYFTLPADRAVRAAGRSCVDGEYVDAARPARGGGRLGGRPGARASCARWTSARCSSPMELYVGLLAATILFLATNAGLIGISRLVYSMGIHRQLPDRAAAAAPEVPHAVDRDHRLQRLRDPRHAARPGDVPRQRLLVRRAAELHDGAPGGDPPADDQAGLPAPLPGPGQRDAGAASTGRCSRSRAASSPRSPSSSSSSCNLTVAAFGVGWLTLGMLVYLLSTGAAGAGPDLDAQGRDPAAGRRSRGRVRLRAGADGRRALRRVRGRDRGQARRAAAARDPRAGAW